MESFNRFFRRFVHKLEFYCITKDRDISRFLFKMLNGPVLTFYERYVEPTGLTFYETCTFLKR